MIPHCRTIDHHEPFLTLEGLRLVHETEHRMTDQEDAGGRSREEEVLRARRASLDRLGDRAFAITLRDAIGVERAGADQPTSANATATSLRITGKRSASPSPVASS